VLLFVFSSLTRILSGGDTGVPSRIEKGNRTKKNIKKQVNHHILNPEDWLTLDLPHNRQRSIRL
jgi:hypothetical protein